jgi:hypothetical protein
VENAALYGVERNELHLGIHAEKLFMARLAERQDHEEAVGVGWEDLGNSDHRCDPAGHAGIGVQSSVVVK